MGERVLCKHEVIGSIPFTSTTFCGWCRGRGWGREKRRVWPLGNRRLVL